MTSILENCDGFDWDEGNSDKNWHLHRVTDRECEEVFANVPIVLVRDESHSGSETRYAARGTSDSDRRLNVIFTMRNRLIRVISARDMTRREKRIYEEKAKRDS